MKNRISIILIVVVLTVIGMLLSEFVHSAFVALQVLAVGIGVILDIGLLKKEVKEGNEHSGNYFTEGMMIGLVIGILIDIFVDSLFDLSLGLGFAIIIGSVIGLIIPKKSLME